MSDYYLIAVILFFSGILSSQILMEHWPSIEIYLVVLFFNTYYFPVLVIYGLILLDGRNKLRKQWLWVYAYPIIYNVFILLDIFVFNSYTSLAEIREIFFKPTKYQLLFYLTQYLYVIIVLVWLWKKLNRYTSSIKNYYSSIENINLNWFRFFIQSLLGLTSFGFVVFTLFSIGVIEDIEIPFGIEYILFIILLFYFCYNGIRQYSLVNLNRSFVEEEVSREKPKEKYLSSNLNEESINAHFRNISQLFDEEKLFLEPQLKIEDIAKRLEISVHKASQIINSKSNNSFFDFVNRYRVEYFKKLLSDPDKRKFTILALGIESGFNSKASMNRVFKNFVGQSPKEFQKSQQDIPL